MSNLNTMNKGNNQKSYTITVQRFNPETRMYEPVEITMTLAQAKRDYEQAKLSGDTVAEHLACSRLNDIRAKAGLKVPVC